MPIKVDTESNPTAVSLINNSSGNYTAQNNNRSTKIHFDQQFCFALPNSITFIYKYAIFSRRTDRNNVHI